MFRTVVAAAAVGVVACVGQGHRVSAQATGAESMPMSMHGAMMTMPLGVPMERAGSGTSWLPDATPLPGAGHAVGAWHVMTHGAIDLYADVQGSRRGASQVGSTNWFMAMAMRPLGRAMLTLDGMMSAEPLTVPDGGYPLLLQTGESYHGVALHDRQHPHNLFMEFAATYQRALSRTLAASIYVAPVGEPALGPVAFMHRPSARSDPFAPISHHWEDATHITFGVVTLGLFTRAVKIEASLFNGREPDEHRYALEFRGLDSWSARASVNPSRRWSVNASVGFLKSPDGLHPDESEYRATMSAMFETPIARRGEWASSVIYGGNKPSVGSVPQAWQHSVTLESDADFDGQNTVFGRITWVQKTAEDLVIPAVAPDRRYDVGAASLGYRRLLTRTEGISVSLGVRGEVTAIPQALQAVYGSRHPMDLVLFLQLRPRPPAQDRHRAPSQPAVPRP